MAQAAVSVALCTRDGAAYIGQQIASILNQTVPVDEIVVSDDDSADDTVAIIERAVRDADVPVRLTILRNRPPLGVTRNFEAAMLVTTGNVIFLSDQDDVWEDTKVAVLLEALEDPTVLLVASDATLVDGDGARLGETLLGRLGATATERAILTGSDGWRALLRRNLVTGATVAFRRTLFDRARPFPSGWLHDEWLAVVAASVGTVALVERPLIQYRIHENNAVGMRRRTVRVMWSRLTARGDERNARLLRRAEQFAERVDTFGAAVPDALRDAARAKLEHERWRSSLPRARRKRIAGVLRSTAAGGYSRFGGGMQDILRDLVQPLGVTNANLYPAGDLPPESDG